ncbi:MAG: hypothetical protein J7L88_06720, partial [Thermoplasmata archaeon]|nr:hypothetical protein [Thermoplasmata archaeon]
MIFLSAIFIPVSNSGRSGTLEIIDEGEMKLQHLSQERTRSTGVVYNMSYVHDSGSLYDIGYDTYVNITSEYVLNGSLGPFEISPNSLIPLFGYFNNNDLLDVFLIKTNITINGTLYSFAIFGYFDFYNNYSELNFTDYDLLILGQRNVTYAGNYVWVYYNFGYGFISPYGYEKYFINNAIYLGDINSDGYDDLIILSYKNTTSKRFERYLSQYGALLLYSAREYKNGTISIIYGGSATSPGVIHCDRGESGTHPDKVVEGVPSTVPGYGMDVVDVDGDGRLDLVYTEKRYEKAAPSFCNITIFVVKDINNVSNGAEFDDVVDITIHWTSGRLDSISTIMEYPTKVIAANLDGNGIPDLIFVEYGYVPPIVGIYDFNLLPGVYSMENIMDFSFEFPSGGGRSNLDYILGLDVARLNYDAIDDICTWGAVWITNPANRYSGNYYIPDPAFVFDTRYSTQKFDGPGTVYT